MKTSIRDKLTFTAAGLALVGVALLGATSSAVADQPDQYPAEIHMIAQQFGLDEEELQMVYDEVRADKSAKEDDYNL